jgi:hypothetical protein
MSCLSGLIEGHYAAGISKLIHLSSALVVFVEIFQLIVVAVRGEEFVAAPAHGCVDERKKRKREKSVKRGKEKNFALRTNFRGSFSLIFCPIKKYSNFPFSIMCSFSFYGAGWPKTASENYPRADELAKQSECGRKREKLKS